MPYCFCVMWGGWPFFGAVMRTRDCTEMCDSVCDCVCALYSLARWWIVCLPHRLYDDGRLSLTCSKNRNRCTRKDVWFMDIAPRWWFLDEGGGGGSDDVWSFWGFFVQQQRRCAAATTRAAILLMSCCTRALRDERDDGGDDDWRAALVARARWCKTATAAAALRKALLSKAPPTRDDELHTFSVHNFLG